MHRTIPERPGVVNDFLGARPAPTRVLKFIRRERRDDVIRADAVVLYACHVEDDPGKESVMVTRFQILADVDRDLIRVPIRVQVHPGTAPKGGRGPGGLSGKAA
jgi:hypothetical protein